MERPETPVFSAIEAGWLRRPELDTRSFDAWEMPNGNLVCAEKGTVPRVAGLLSGWPPL